MSQKYSNMLSFAGFSCAVTCFFIGLYLLILARWDLLCLDALLLLAGLLIFAQDVLRTYSQVHSALRRILTHRWGD
jgi:hypothetical protein